MRRNGVLLALVVALLALLAAAGGSAAPDATARSGKGARLQSFGSCGNLLAYARKHTLPLVGAWGFGGVPGGREGMPATATSGVARAGEADTSGVDFSTTNVQEEGVDEPDIVKSNGSTLFAVHGDRLFAVDVRGSKPKLVGSLQLPANASYELLLHGERLLVLSRGGVRRHRRAARGRVGIVVARSLPAADEPDRGGRRRPRRSPHRAQPHARRRLRERPPRRHRGPDRDRLGDAAGAAVRDTRRLDARGDRGRAGAQPRRREDGSARQLGSLPTR